RRAGRWAAAGGTQKRGERAARGAGARGGTRAGPAGPKKRGGGGPPPRRCPAAPSRARVDTESVLPLPRARDFLSDFFGLVGFERERPLPVRDRLSDVPLPFGEIAQVLFDRGVVGLALVRRLQMFLRF